MNKKEKIFLVDDDALIVSMLSRTLKKEGYEVHSESAEFGDIVNTIVNAAPDIVLLDIQLLDTSGIDILERTKKLNPAIQIIMVTSDDTIETAVKCMKLGAADYLTKPFNVEEVKLVIANVLEKAKLKHEVSYLRTLYEERFDKDIIGNSEAIQKLRAQMEKIAKSRVPSILVTGESGTGKELVARCMHRMMNAGPDRAYAPFIAVNCSALPDTLLESELFGHEKGAFTDAKTEKKGIFEFANNGTILLDEIGEMKLDLQSKLLRVLEERTVRRVGGRHEIRVDVTVITTTNRNIPEAIEKGEFRRDLFYRLNTFSFQIPPLRERREDIIPLARHYLGYFSAQYKNKTLHSISPEAEELLRQYDWPGNVRELKNVIERIVVLETGQEIMPEHLPREIACSPAPADATGSKRFILPDEGISLDELERDLIMQALEKSKNNRVTAAKLLGISYDTLRYQLKKSGLTT
jgi:DNA-binding NtrC family response regulator